MRVRQPQTTGPRSSVLAESARPTAMPCVHMPCTVHRFFVARVSLRSGYWYRTHKSEITRTIHSVNVCTVRMGQWGTVPYGVGKLDVPFCL